MKKWTLLIVVFIAVNTLLSSCSINLNDRLGDDEEETNDYSFLNNNMEDVLDTGPVKGGILNLFSTAPDTLNPILTANAYVKDYSCFIFESLVKLDKNQKPVPLLAESWEASSDGIVWTFYLRDNVYWHDSIPLSAEDVEFTVSTMMNGNVNSPYRTNVKNITSFSAVDPKTFRVVLNSPNSFTPELMTFPVLPKHYFLGEDILTTPKNNRPVGTGAYKFLEYKENGFVKLKSNEKWWNRENKDENGLDFPYVEEIDIKIFSKDSSVINAFQSKQIDVIATDRTGWIGYSGRSDITLKKHVSNKFEFVAFNLSNKILREKEVRKAIAYTVDKVKLINDIMPGEAVASDLPVIPDTWMNDSNVLSYYIDVDKAKELLADNGWQDKNGVLYKRIDGVNTPLVLEMLVNSENDIRFEAAEEIKKQLMEVGITININKVKWEEEMNKINSGKFDMVFIGSTVTSVPDISFLYSSAEIGTGLNIAGYKNENVDRYLYQILFEKDPSRKKAYFMNMKELINQDIPYLGLYFYNDAVIYNKRIRGEFNPCVWNKYDDFARWYIPIR